MKQVCDYCGHVFEEDEVNCPNCGSVSTRVIQPEDYPVIEEF
jgi:RNA polymerase subunit RPABC4/transcription elongation factor Spt4